MFKGFKDLLNKVEQTISGIDKTVNPKLSELQKNVQEKLKPISSMVDVPVEKKVATNLSFDSKKMVSVLTDSFANVTVSDNIPVEFYRDNVLINAGMELIQKYENDSLLIRNKTKEIVNKAGDADFKIAPVYQHIVHQKNMWNQLIKDFAVLPDIVTTITTIKTDLDSICDRIDKLENILTEQIEIVSGQELQAWKDLQVLNTEKIRAKKQQELVSYENELKIAFVKREQKHLELEKLKALERIEEQRIKAKEKEREDKLREQQLELERQREMTRMREELNNQFQKEVEAYKAYGTLPPKKSEGNTKTLDQVELPNDPSVEDFLGSESLVSTVSQSQSDDSDYKLVANPNVTQDQDEIEEIQTPVKQNTENQTTKSDDVPSTPTTETTVPTTEINEDEKVEDVDESWYT